MDHFEPSYDHLTKAVLTFARYCMNNKVNLMTIGFIVLLCIHQGSAFGFFKKIANKVKNSVVNVADKAGDAMVNIADKTEDAFVDGFDKMGDSMVDGFDKMEGFTVNTFNKAKNGIKKAVNKVKSLPKNIIHKSKNFFENIFHKVKKAITDVMNFMKELMAWSAMILETVLYYVVLPILALLLIGLCVYGYIKFCLLRRIAMAPMMTVLNSIRRRSSKNKKRSTKKNEKDVQMEPLYHVPPV